MNRLVFTVLLALTFALRHSHAALVIDTVPVGNAGNSNDSTGFGGVGYNYGIGTYEVTNGQYVEFLNAVAATDPFALYNANMGSNARGGITQSGSSGSFTYAVKTSMGNKPVNYVSWFDAIRFANWLHNGQGNSSTETGAYTLLGGTPMPSNANSITRNAGATWVLPSENEWYKAAYHQNDGATGNYFDYPTSSDSVPTVATANSVGDISNPGTNVANYNSGADWNGQDGNVTSVGTAGTDSDSPYFIFDQGGNVWEWNETLTGDPTFFPFRGLRGASWLNLSHDMLATHRPAVSAGVENLDIGFRVAAIPEPSPILLLGAVTLITLGVRRWFMK